MAYLSTDIGTSIFQLIHDVLSQLKRMIQFLEEKVSLADNG